MASFDILCSNPLNLKSKVTKIEYKKIICAPSKILKNISWLINICLKYFMTPTKMSESAWIRLITKAHLFGYGFLGWSGSADERPVAPLKY